MRNKTRYNIGAPFGRAYRLCLPDEERADPELCAPYPQSGEGEK